MSDVYWSSLRPALPAFLLFFGAVVLLPPIRLPRIVAFGVALAAVFAAAGARFANLNGGAGQASELVADRLSFVLTFWICATTSLLLLTLARVEKLRSGAVYAGILIAASGLCIASVADTLALAFCGFAVTLNAVAATGCLMGGRAQNEKLDWHRSVCRLFVGAAIAQMLVGAGIALIASTTGLADLSAIADQVLRRPTSEQPRGLLLGMMLVATGLSLSMFLAPLHHWFLGAATSGGAPHFAVFSILPMMAGSIGFLRLVMLPLMGDARGLGLAGPCTVCLWLAAMPTLLLAVVGAVAARDRIGLLGAVTMAQGAQILGSIASGAYARDPGTVQGWTAALVQLLIFPIAVAGLSIAMQCGKTIGPMLAPRPLLSTATWILLAGVLGLPPTVGCWGKASLLLAGFSGGPYLPMRRVFALVAIGVLVIQATLVLRQWSVADAPPSEEDAAPGWMAAAAICIAGALLAAGLWPAPLLIAAGDLQRDMLVR